MAGAKGVSFPQDEDIVKAYEVTAETRPPLVKMKTAFLGGNSQLSLTKPNDDAVRFNESMGGVYHF